MGSRVNAGQSMKTTLFLGAGASVFAGIPTTKELVSAVMDRVIHREKWESEVTKHLVQNIVEQHRDKDVEELYKTIHDMIAAEKMHKTVAEYKAKDGGAGKRQGVKTTRSNNPGNATIKDEAEDIDETVRALESLETAVRNTLLTNLTVKQEKNGNIVSTYNGLFRCVSRNIVTTNYDNVLETYCKMTGLDLVNGFKRSHLGDSRVWDDVWEGGETALRLTKLHGSITWQEDDNGGVLEIGMPGLRDPKKDVMIAPTLGEKNYKDKIFPILMDRFKTILDETELLIVVGFSFRDPEINRMLRGRLKRTSGNSRPMRLLYMDPEPDGLKKLVGSGVEPHMEYVFGNDELWNYSQDEIPYAFASGDKFGQGVVGRMEYILRIMDVVCNRENSPTRRTHATP